MDTPTYSAFHGSRHLGTGPLADILAAAYPFRSELPLVFDRHTGRQLDFDWQGTLDEVLGRALPPEPKAGPGRPKLGVVSTEVTLLPRHWDWLNAQPARASGTLRRLVEEAMARDAADPKKRWEALGKVLWALAGDAPGFEEASRALYAQDRGQLETLTANWPGDLPQFIREWI